MSDPIPFQNQREVLLRAENESLKETARALHQELQKAQGFLLMSSQNTFRLNALLLYAAGGSLTLHLKDFQTFNFDDHMIDQIVTEGENQTLTLTAREKTDEERAAEGKAKHEAERAAARSQILLPGQPGRLEN